MDFTASCYSCTYAQVHGVCGGRLLLPIGVSGLDAWLLDTVDAAELIEALRNGVRGKYRRLMCME
jgi:hypothetical protein